MTGPRAHRAPSSPPFGPGPLTFVSAVRWETRPCWKLALGLSVPDTSYSGCAGDKFFFQIFFQVGF